MTHTCTVCLLYFLLPGALCVLTIRAQRVQLLFDLHLVRGACVLWQESHQPLV